MQTVWVLGAGQLGAMLQQAAYPLALRVIPLDPDDRNLPEISNSDLITAEREQWPETPMTTLLSQHPNFVNADVFWRIADRFHQKSLLDSLGVATAPWRDVEADTASGDLHNALGEKVLLKRRTGGYDGKGQYWLNRAQPEPVPEDWRGTAIAEQKIPFMEELSLVGGRDRDGKKVFYPLTLNLHSDGILMASVAPLSRVSHLQGQAEAMLGKIMDAMSYVGVMAMECFRVDDTLIVNELAPRVHNSGHWTQAGACVSQFEMHLRAVAGLPLKAPEVRGRSAMINLIGMERETRWLEVPACQVYWYGKEVRPGRKLGHININHPETAPLHDALTALRPLLPEHYGKALDWVAESL